MAAQNYFDHTSLDGRTFTQRIDATGYAWSTAGENIAAGYPSIDAVMDGWIQSPGHCANLMNQDFTEIGVACVPGTSSTTYRTTGRWISRGRAELRGARDHAAAQAHLAVVQHRRLARRDRPLRLRRSAARSAVGAAPSSVQAASAWR